MSEAEALAMSEAEPMAIGEEHPLLAQLNFYIGLTLSLTAIACVWSYVALPNVMPGEAKTPFWSFFFGTSCLKYVRRPGDRAMTADDFPDSGGTKEHNIEDMAAKIEALWSPGDKARLFNRLLWQLVPWWFFSMCLFGAERAMNFISASYCGPCVFVLILAPRLTFNLAMAKLMLLGFILAVGSAAVNNWCKLILALRGTDPVYAGIALMIVRKLHRLDSKGLMTSSSAEAQQIAQESYNLAVSCWVTPLQTAVMDMTLGIASFYQLHSIIGLMGIFVCAASIAALWGMGTLCDRMRTSIDQDTYEATIIRQTALNMILDNFRELRLYEWVQRIAKPLDGVRTRLRSNFWWGAILSSLSGVFSSQIDGIMTVSACLFMVFVRGETVDLTKAMTARAYMATLMMVITSLSMCRYSWYDMVQRTDRIEAFLRLSEVKPSNLRGPLELLKASFAWPAAEGAEPQPVLEELELKAADGELVLVCGAVGSGKSSLLQALLGEVPLIEGERQAPAVPMAYQPQVPYLIEGTIRENVLFGDDYDEARLKEALRAAQLAVDIANPGNTLYAKGELTNVGKRGTHLSGGQRARTALARATYAVLGGANFALLDDPVASVDNEVVQAAWDGAVLGAMKGATRIVVVNSQLLERLAHSADRLIVLSERRVVYNGPPAEAMRDPDVLNKALSGKYKLAGGLSARPDSWAWKQAGVSAIQQWAAAFGNPKEGDPFTAQHLAMVQSSSPVPVTFEGLAEQGMIMAQESGPAQQALPDLKEEEIEEANGEDSAMLLADMLRDSEPLRNFLRHPIQTKEGVEDEPLPVAASPLQLNSDEWEQLRVQLKRIERQYKHEEPSGKAKLTVPEVVLQFTRTSRGAFMLAMLMAVALGFKDAAVIYVIQAWSEGRGGRSNQAYLWMLIAVFVGFALLAVTITFVDSIGALRLTMHNMKEVDETLVRIGMPFFWRKKQLAEPQIRKVVNTDLGGLSGIGRLPMMCIECLILISITGYRAPALWLLMPISCVGYYHMSFLPNWRTLEMWPLREQIQNSAWAKVVEQWDVLFPMRALGRSKAFAQQIYKGIMVVPYSNMMQFQLEILLGFFQHTVGAIFNAVAIVLMINMKIGGSDPTLSYTFWILASNFSAKVNNLVNMYNPFKDLLKQYDQMQDLFCSDTLETAEGDSPPEGWPTAGKLDFEDVTFRYVAYLPAALKGITFTVKPAEKLGVVGKTGSGKSTLVSLLLRLGPLHGVAPGSGGRVLLDGVDVSTLRLSDLRQRVAVVPQEPTLFSMSLKENIGEEFTDAEVLTALQWCGLDARQAAGTEGPVADALAAPLRAGGLSVGQQQLLMAARALVRRPKVLVLDECTASLDRESADRLLEVLGTHSAEATVLAIAHRLRFVLQADRILVLEAGRVIACDTPANLLAQPDSYFAKNLRYEQQEDVEESKTTS